MKLHNFPFIFLLLLSLTACKKSALDYTNETDPAPGGTSVSTGNFMKRSHATSGTARLVTDSNNRRFLVFENFSTDNGPDLRVWLSPNTGALPYQEVGPLIAVSGNFSYELPTTIDPVLYSHVLIWCKPFSVLFGYAILQ